MKIKGIVVKPLDQQHDTDGVFIDPKGVKLPEEAVPLWNNFDYTVPESVMGFGKLRLEDGAIVFEGELSEAGVRAVGLGLDKLAIGIRADAGLRPVTSSDFIAVSLGTTHKDPDQPEIELEDVEEASEG